MRKNGFTLVELLGVITLMALIAFISFPIIQKSIKNSKNQIGEATMKLITNSVSLYMDDYADDYPIKANQTYCIKLRDVVLSGNLTSPILDGNTGKEISLEKHVKVIIDSNKKLNYELVEICS